MDETAHKVQIFEEILFFKLRATEKQKKKKTNNSIYLVPVNVGGWRKEKGTRLTKKKKVISNANP